MYAAPSIGQNFLAVMDLVSDGTISQNSIIDLSDKIGQSVNDSSYSQFDRSTLPELLKQLDMNDTLIASYDPNCLIIVGSLIGANTVLGGLVTRNKDSVNIKLYLVAVEKKQTLSEASLSSVSPKMVLLEKEIPELVKPEFSIRNAH